jgi:hypothetical protein
MMNERLLNHYQQGHYIRNAEPFRTKGAILREIKLKSKIFDQIITQNKVETIILMNRWNKTSFLIYSLKDFQCAYKKTFQQLKKEETPEKSLEVI